MKLRLMIALCVTLITSSQAYAKWQLMDGSQGMNALQIIANPDCQPRQDEKQRVGDYVVDVAAYSSCKRWIVSVEDFRAAFAITDSKNDVKAAQTTLLGMVQRQGATDSQILNNKLLNISPKPVYSWVMQAKQDNSDADSAYAAAKMTLPSIISQCPDAIALHQEPSAPRYATASNPTVMILSRQCKFVVSYQTTISEIDDSNDEQYVNGLYDHCSKEVVPYIDTTCANTTKEVKVLSEYRY